VPGKRAKEGSDSYRWMPARTASQSWQNMDLSALGFRLRMSGNQVADSSLLMADSKRKKRLNIKPRSLSERKTIESPKEGRRTQRRDIYWDTYFWEWVFFIENVRLVLISLTRLV